MLTVSAASRLAVSGAKRAVVVAGQRRAVQVIRRTCVRGIQSMAQTDRVGGFQIFSSFFNLTLFD